MAAGSFRDLTVYKKAFELAMDIFKTSKSFPAEDKYSLTDQIRRSSRSVCSCIGEAYRKRHYIIKHTLLVNQLMQIWRIQRREFGLILHWRVII